MELLGLLWNEGLVRPMLNSIVLLYILLFHNLALAIIVFTLIVNGLTLPLTLRSVRQTQAMASLGPRLQEVRSRYGNNRERMSQETMRLYREHGVNPVGCLGPMIIQMPIMLGLYWALIKVLPAAPERLADLSALLYTWLPEASTALPLQSSFLGIDLAQVGGVQGVVGYVVMVLVGASMWVSMRMSTPMSGGGGGAQQQTQQMMQWIFPVMIGFLSFSFPVGLSVYWIASSIIRALIQVGVTRQARLVPAPAAGAAQGSQPAPMKEVTDHAAAGSDGEDRRRSYRDRPQAARRRARRGRNRGR